MASRTLPFAAWALVMCMSVPAHAQGNQAAQVEKGRRVVAQACTTCHTTLVRMMQVHKQTAEQWKETVYFMISRGAQVMPDEIEAVTAFLAATSGRGPPAAGGARQQRPDGDGAAILQRNCQQCHEAAIVSTKPDSEDWGSVVTRMMTYGARLTPAEQQTLIGYLNAFNK